MSNRPVHFEIHASDIGKSVAFYRDLFGWKIEKYPIPGEYWGVTTGPEGQPGINGAIMQRMGPPPVDGAALNSWCVTVDVADIDKAFAKALQLGGREALPKMTIPHVGYIAYIKDVDGNIVGLHQSDPGAR
jgi:predicted enzyme related to lactoylglutathione lyase